jgi:hypothetical protein
MSDIKIQPSGSGTAVVTLTAPTTNTARTITFPDATGTLINTGSDLPAAQLTGTVADARISALTASKLTGALPAISGASLTNLPADSTKLPLAGGTLTGDLIISENDPNLRMVDTNTGSYSQLTNTNGSLKIEADLGAGSGSSTLEFTVDNSTKMTITSDGKGRSEFTIGAWINFNGQGTVAIRDSHNVSSITDGATGDYIVYFDTNFASANHAGAVDCGMGVSPNVATMRQSASYMVASAYRIGVRATSNQAWVDEDYVSGMWVGPV